MPIKHEFPNSFNSPQPDTGPAQNGLTYCGQSLAKQLLVAGGLAIGGLVASLTDQSITILGRIDEIELISSGLVQISVTYNYYLPIIDKLKIFIFFLVDLHSAIYQQVLNKF